MNVCVAFLFVKQIFDTKNRTLLLALLLIPVPVFYAMLLLWSDELDEPHLTAQPRPVLASRYDTQSHAGSKLGNTISSPSEARAIDHAKDLAQANEQVMAVVFLLQQLQKDARGIVVVGANQQGLSARLGLSDGDQITEINGQAVHSLEQVQAALSGYRPQHILHFKGRREGIATTWTYQAMADD